MPWFEIAGFVLSVLKEAPALVDDVAAMVDTAHTLHPAPTDHMDAIKAAIEVARQG